MHTIFMVHGMGDPEDGWHTEAEDALKTAYGVLELPVSFEDIYSIKPINYNNVFADHLAELDSHNDRFELLRTLQGEAPNGLIDAVVKAAERNPTDDFVYTHAADVLLYSATRMQGEVVSTVQTQLSEALRGGQRWSVIAFSLGTRVIHDVLQSSYTANTDFRRGFGKPQCLMTVANVGRVLQELTGGDIYQSAVRPSPMVDEGGCYHYLNIRHELDPFTYPRPFRPPLTWQESEMDGQTINMYRDIFLPAEDTSQINVHDLAHYLSNPRATRDFFEYTYQGPRPRDPLIDDSRFGTLYTNYQNQTAVGEAEAIIEELEKLTRKPFSSWKQIQEIWIRFAKIVDHIAQIV